MRPLRLALTFAALAVVTVSTQGCLAMAAGGAVVGAAGAVVAGAASMTGKAVVGTGRLLIPGDSRDDRR